MAPNGHKKRRLARAPRHVGLVEHVFLIRHEALIFTFPKADCGFLANIFIRIVET